MGRSNAGHYISNISVSSPFLIRARNSTDTYTISVHGIDAPSNPPIAFDRTCVSENVCRDGLPNNTRKGQGEYKSEMY